MRRLLFILLLCSVPTLAATVWKWRDASGVIHYSDQYVTGAEQVNIQSSTTYSPVDINIQANTQASSSASAAAFAGYNNVEIWQPSNEQTIANTAGAIDVKVRVEPDLQKGDRLALYQDGRLVAGFPAQGNEYQLTEVERGAHSLTLVVLDAKGQQVASSAAVTYYVQQPSALKPR